MKKIFISLSLILICSVIYSQNLTTTLGASGIFTIKDASNNYMTLSQSTGQVNILKTLRLENTTSSGVGIIFKGTNSFLHDYQAPGTNGYNTFLGVNAGNFTMSGSGNLASYNTGIGYSSLSNTTTGYQNTAVGWNSLFSNTTGYQNTALGMNSLNSNTSGFNNTALGSQSLSFNTTGYWNTALGYQSLYSNTTAIANTAVGWNSLLDNTTGSYNTALGLSALNLNTTGYNNTALGYQSLFSNTTGYYNTAVGNLSLYFNTAGYQNSVLGYQSLVSNTTGYNNTALGYNSGSNITTGGNLTCIGYNALSTTGTATNQITLGDANITSLRCNVTTITSLSDMRDKKNIKDLSLGLDFLMKLKPRQFNWDKREWYDNNKSDGSKMKETPTAGFIAQELDSAQTSANSEWLNLVLKDNPEKWEATSGNLLPVVVKAVQELNQKCESLESENKELKNEIESLKDVKEKLAKLEQAQIELSKIVKEKTDNDVQKTKYSSGN